MLDVGKVLSLLDDPTVRGAWHDGQTIHLYWSSQAWSLDHLAQLRQVLRQLDGGLREPDVIVQSLPNQDWKTQWVETVKPLWVGTRIVIRPSWETVDARPGQIEIVLDPKQAFGTGHHATTRMLLEWLEELIQGNESVLDVGTEVVSWP